MEKNEKNEELQNRREFFKKKRSLHTKTKGL